MGHFKRLLLICDYPPGPLANISASLDQVGLINRVLLRKRGNRDWRDEKTHIINLPLQVFGEEEPITLPSMLSLIAYLVMATSLGIIVVIKKRLDLILGVFAFPQGIVAVLIGLATRRKVAVQTDGGDVDIILEHPLARHVVLPILRAATVVTAQSKTKLNRLASLGIKATLCPIIGVDTSRFDYSPLSQKQKGLLLYVGRLSGEKRPEVLLRACGMLRKEGTDFRLLLVGDGALRNQLIDTAGGMGIIDSVTFTGYVSHSEVHQLFRKSLIFVLPSTREGRPVSLLEGMSSGCVCIVSDISDNRDLIENMHNGITFRLNDAEDLAKKLRWAISHPSECATMAANGRHLVEGEHSLQAVAGRLRILLANLENSSEEAAPSPLQVSAEKWTSNTDSTQTTLTREPDSTRSLRWLRKP